MKNGRKIIQTLLTAATALLFICAEPFKSDSECLKRSLPETVSVYEDTIPKTDTLDAVDSRLDTIAFVLVYRETGGTLNEKAVNGSGTHVGLLQMDTWWVKKANEYSGLSYRNSDRFCGRKSVEIWKIHQYKRNTKISLENSTIDALTEACRIHSGGSIRKTTVEYCKRVYEGVVSGEIEYVNFSIAGRNDFEN